MSSALAQHKALRQACPWRQVALQQVLSRKVLPYSLYKHTTKEHFTRHPVSVLRAVRSDMVSTQGNGFTVSAAGNSRVAVNNVKVLDADNRSNFCATIALWRPN